MIAQEKNLEDFQKERIAEMENDYDTIPVITYNGKEISYEEYLNLPPYRIGSVAKYGYPLSQRLYGEKGKNGVISLFERRNFEVKYDFISVDEHNFTPTYFYESEIPATFPGGDDSLRTFLDKNTNVPDDFYDVEIDAFAEVLCYIDENGNVVKHIVRSIHIIHPDNVEVLCQEKENENGVFSEPYKKRINIMKEVTANVVMMLPPFRPAISFLHPVKYVKPLYVVFKYPQRHNYINSRYILTD